MSDLVQIVDGKLVIEVDTEMVLDLLNYAPDTCFITQEDKDIDPETFEGYTVITDIDKFLPNIVDQLNSEDEIGLTSVLRTISQAAWKAVDNGEIDGCAGE